MRRLARGFARPAACVVVAAVMVGSGGGCAIQQRKERTARIVRAAKVTAALGPMNATLESDVLPAKLNGERVKGLSRVTGLPWPSATMQLDLAKQRAVLTPAAPGTTVGAAGAASGSGGRGAIGAMIAGAMGRVPNAVAFSKWDVFVQPRAAAAGAGAAAASDGASPSGVPWLWLDGTALDPDRTTRLVQPTPVLLLAPHLLVLLLHGALSGSVTDLGAQDVGGVSTTHLRFNVDRDKAAGDLSDKDKQRLELLFKADDIDGTFFNDAEVWIDKDDVVRRLTVRLEQTIDADTAFRLTYRLDLMPPTPAAAPVTLALPSADDLAEVPTLPELLPGTAA